MTAPVSEEIARIVGECAGFVSVCWDPKPDGVFDSEPAAAQIDKAVDEILTLLREQVQALFHPVGRTIEEDAYNDAVRDVLALLGEES